MPRIAGLRLGLGLGLGVGRAMYVTPVREKFAVCVTAYSQAMRSLESSSRTSGGQMRWYASDRRQRGQAKQMRMSAHGILDPSVPAPLGSFRAWVKYGKKQLGSTLMYSFYWVWKRKERLGPEPKKCLQDIQKSYIDLNKAIARGDIDHIARLVTPRVQQALQAQVKAAKKSNILAEWEGKPVKMIKHVHYVRAEAPSNSHPNGVMPLEQYTVQITLEVTSATYMNGKLVAGDPDKKELMKEYVVVERMGETGPWLFAGKVVPNAQTEEPAESTSA
ncbi:hypothetical protein BJ742DRAFT_567432 [Cladochytrium replicatum]|nr:hypothetical protein BJ742DRAFT_567432 [Cladochytrium replicatum]